MKRAIPLSLIVCAAIVPTIVLFSHARFPTHAEAPAEGPRDFLSADEIALLRPGDIVLRGGVSAESLLISRFAGGRGGFSHCGILVVPGPRLRGRCGFTETGREPVPGKLAVIHSVNEKLSGVDGVQLQDLENFNRYSRSGSVVIVRPRMDDPTLRRCLSRAEEMLAGELPFDNEYRLDTADSVYCTELVYRAFADSLWPGSGAFTLARGIVSFDGFLDSRHFDVIISHNRAIPAR